jgi:hypothetical protein
MGRCLCQVIRVLPISATANHLTALVNNLTTRLMTLVSLIPQMSDGSFLLQVMTLARGPIQYLFRLETDTPFS